MTFPDPSDRRNGDERRRASSRNGKSQQQDVEPGDARTHQPGPRPDEYATCTGRDPASEDPDMESGDGKQVRQARRHKGRTQVDIYVVPPSQDHRFYQWSAIAVETLDSVTNHFTNDKPDGPAGLERSYVIDTKHAAPSDHTYRNERGSAPDLPFRHTDSYPTATTLMRMDDVHVRQSTGPGCIVQSQDGRAVSTRPGGSTAGLLRESAHGPSRQSDRARGSNRDHPPESPRPNHQHGRHSNTQRDSNGYVQADRDPARECRCQGNDRRAHAQPAIERILLISPRA